MENTTADTMPISTNSSGRKIRLEILGGILVAIICYALYYFIVTVPREKILERTANYYKSLLGNDPVPLQNQLVADLQAGKNDKFTKSDAYFIMHRFFDNGGNIYEVYDYVNAHPELSFLNKAETFYPKVFAQIKDGVLPHVFVDRALYAYLAYVEVLYENGYADIAAPATLANQYAKLAYFTTTIAKEMPKEAGAARSMYAKRDARQSLYFIKKGEQDIQDILDGKITTNDITARDMLVGLNQYGAALRYLEALGVGTSTPISSIDSRKVFAFATELSHKSVPELVLFTSLVNASTLAILASSTPAEIKVALYPILDLDMKNVKVSDNSIIHKVINSRLEVQPKDVGDSYQDVYSKRNTLRLASKVPEFKSWLILNGWTESDFK